MNRPRSNLRSAFSLLEITLVLGLLVLVAAVVLPVTFRDLGEEQLPASAREMRSLVSLVRSRAMMDGKQYRIRFPREEELDPFGGSTQPIIERENEPFEDPDNFEVVTEPWARREVLKRGVRCVQVRLGKPTLDEELVEDMQAEFELRMDAMGEDFDEDFPPLDFDLDGTSEWAVFVLTDHEGEVDVEEIEDLPITEVIEVIVDGLTGLIWLQRPFADEEKIMLLENDWPPIMRQDFLRPQLLTEDDILEIQESKVRKQQ